MNKLKKEILGITAILVFIFLYSYWNYLVSLMKSRDVQRRDDITAIMQALDSFYNDFDRYPLSSDSGEIIACLPEGWERKDMKVLLGGRPIENRQKMFNAFAPCKWGESALEDFSAEGKDLYLTRVPIDMKASDGWSYRYFSTGEHYQLFGSFEGKSMPEYSVAIVKRNLMCGEKVCNFGKGSRGTPLDMSLKEYENKLSR